MDRTDVVRRCFEAYETGDRSALEPLLADGFTFTSPADIGIGIDTYWERCWPANETTRSFEFVRLAEIGDEVVATYEAEKTDGRRFRNTEVFGFDGDRVKTVEVYFGWDL